MGWLAIIGLLAGVLQDGAMGRRLEKTLLCIAELIYRVKWQAWMKLARRSTIGEILAEPRGTEQRCAQLEAECDLLRSRLARMSPA